MLILKLKMSLYVYAKSDSFFAFMVGLDSPTFAVLPLSL